jgi:hypothetical protein
MMVVFFLLQDLGVFGDDDVRAGHVRRDICVYKFEVSSIIITQDFLLLNNIHFFHNGLFHTAVTVRR